MRITCNVIRDILPLYVENMVSADTRSLVKEHIASCRECKDQLDEMEMSHDLPPDVYTAPFKKIRAALRKNKLHMVISAVMLILAAAVAAVLVLTAPRYMPYCESDVTVEERDDGTVRVIFGEEVSGFYADHSTALIGPGYSYHITAWDNLWNRYISQNPLRSAVLNTEGEIVAAVYYYDITRRVGPVIADGAFDILIYGVNQVPSGGVATLPRLVLAYYAFFALILAILCAIAAYLFRRHAKVGRILQKTFLLPLAYLLAGLCIKGFNFVSYSATRDFLAILLLTIPLYILLLSLTSLIKEYRRI